MPEDQQPVENVTAGQSKKPWYKSKTIRFNAAVACLAAVEANAHLIQPYVPGNVFGYGLMLLTIGNTLLRFLTTQGVGR